MGLQELSSVRDSTDQLVHSVQYYSPKSLFLHFYIAPFLAIYSLLFYVFITQWSDDDEATEIYFITIGILVLVQILVFLSSLWSVHCLCFLAYNKCKTVLNAPFAKVIPTPNNGSTELIRIHRTRISGDTETLWFLFQKTKYAYNFKTNEFEQVYFPTDHSLQTYQECRGYQTDEDLEMAEKYYGKNNLEMDIPEFWTLFRERATAPFFVFQVFCVALWCLDEFWYYSLFTLFMLVAFESILVMQQLRNMAEIRKMGNKPYQVMVYRNRKWRPSLSSELVPGDIISIGRSQENDLVPCDLILLRGSCIVDESMLTGESVPQMKEPIETLTENRKFNIDSDGKLHMLYGGTKILQHTAPAKSSSTLKAGDNGCLAYVLRTGFQTSQGKLLRTILYGVQRVTANNAETFAFICFLLVFAVAAAWYVWTHASEDPKRNKYKLILECALILTSVVPPELPIELSLAVNSSLTSLIKLYIFCTEPFRIPFAGKVDICCFDKTGTLTSNDLIVEGIAGFNEKNSSEIVQTQDAPIETVQVLATCHSLVFLDDGLVGDPLEKSTLKAIDWNLTKGDTVVPRKGKQAGLRIFHRNHFSSSLKRMSVLASFNNSVSGETSYFAAIKGAPEVLKPMFSKLPSNYDNVYLEMSRKGARVLALGRKNFSNLSHSQIRSLSREDLEKNLDFAGFIIISCPLKPDSKATMKEIINSSHYVMMITGDAPLTACHVAKELYFISDKKPTLILSYADNEKLQWKSIDESIKLPLIPDKAKEFFHSYELCMTGDSLNAVLDFDSSFFVTLLPKVRVFARVAPKQKEFIITSLRFLGFCTLMCGDGTNDVGALKHAQVGVALLSNPLSSSKLPQPSQPQSPSSTMQQNGDYSRRSINDALHERTPRNVGSGRNRLAANQSRNFPAAQNNLAGTANNHQRAAKAQERIDRLLKQLEEQDQAQFVKLGDASIAAPFTSKLSSVQCISHIIRQGRCTLVTTLQMFKILALNALILAYCQSVLYLDGIKFSDGQATLQGLFLTGCFLFITRSKPLDVLSRRRPLSNIFNIYTILTVLLQFAVHFVTLVYLVQEATSRSPPRIEKFADLETEFKPSLLNSTVYIISVSLQVATFAVNYKGHPFMCSLKENKPLMYSILGSFVLVIILVTGSLPEFSEQFSIVPFPHDFQILMLSVLFGDLILAVIIDRICEFLFDRTSLKSI